MPVPSPTSDLELIRRDLHTFGVAVIRDVFTADEVTSARTLLEVLADEERRNGTAILEDGAAIDGRHRPGRNQRVLSLLPEGEVFCRIATNRALLAVASGVFASSYGYARSLIRDHGLDRLQLSSMTANIANPGGKAMELHADQGFVPPTTPYPIILNVVVPLVDFTPENGATRVAPGTHRADPAVLHFERPEARAVEVPTGSAILIDGRTWHGTGQNRTDVPRPAILLNYCPPWVRPFANHSLEVDDQFLATASPTLLRLLGYEPWFVFGASEARRLDRCRSGDRTDRVAATAARSRGR